MMACRMLGSLIPSQHWLNIRPSQSYQIRLVTTAPGRVHLHRTYQPQAWAAPDLRARR